MVLRKQKNVRIIEFNYSEDTLWWTVDKSYKGWKIDKKCVQSHCYFGGVFELEDSGFNTN